VHVQKYFSQAGKPINSLIKLLVCERERYLISDDILPWKTKLHFINQQHQNEQSLNGRPIIM